MAANDRSQLLEDSRPTSGPCVFGKLSRMPLRITFVLPGRGLSGGIRVVVIHGNKLIERGHQVTIVCLHSPWPRRPTRLLQRLRDEIGNWTGWTRDHVHDFKGAVRTGHVRDLGGAVPDGDVVIATHWTTADPVAGLGKRKGRKAYFLQNYEAHSFDPDKVDATWRLPLQKIVVAHWLQDLARDRFGDPSAVLVPNGVDTQQFHAPPRHLQTPPTVGFMYSPAAFKNVGMAFEAVELVRRQIRDLRVVSFGAVKPEGDNGATAGMQFFLRPPQDRLRDIYSSTDIWLCTSNVEGFGLPVLEAMACRCPVVTARCGGVDDFVNDGVNGYLVNVGDPAAMAERILTLLSDRNRWARMSDAAFETRLRFSWDHAVDLLETAITP